MTRVSDWFTDTSTSATLFIAVVAGLFAVYQLRAMPAERRRRILNGMIELWKVSRDSRARLLSNGDPLLLQGYLQVKSQVTRAAAFESTNEEGDDRAMPRRRDLEVEARYWGGARSGISYTAAHEVLASELKFRSLLWSVEQIQLAEDGEPSVADKTMVATARQLVNDLTDFLVDYESGAYPNRQLFGTLHRSIAPTACALTPYVWAGSLRGRWGRRVLRMSISAQHFNDVTAIHRVFDLYWDWRVDGGMRADVLIHPAQTRDVFGHEFPAADQPRSPLALALLRLRVRAAYWKVVSVLNPRPRWWFNSYGGWRLYRHSQSEQKLAAALNFAREEGISALDLEWTLKDLGTQLGERVKTEQRRYRDQGASGA